MFDSFLDNSCRASAALPLLDFVVVVLLVLMNAGCACNCFDDDDDAMDDDDKGKANNNKMDAIVLFIMPAAVKSSQVVTVSLLACFRFSLLVYHLRRRHQAPGVSNVE